MTVPAIRITFTKDEISEIAKRLEDILSSGQLSNGRYVRTFEERFREVLMRDQADCVAVSNGTDAIEVAFRAAGLGAGWVICSSNTSAATAWGILQAGLRPIFVGCDEELQIDVDQVEEAVRWHRRVEGAAGPPVIGVVATHIGGIISKRIADLRELCDRHQLFLLEDAAHAHGASRAGVQAGAIGDAAAFSFFATKTVTSCEGGMISTKNSDLIAAARTIRDQGKRPGTANDHIVRGSNFRLTEVAAAVGIQDVERWHNNYQRRLEARDRYVEALQRVPYLSFLADDDGCDRVLSFYKLIILTPAPLRDAGVSLSGPVYDVALHEQSVMYAEGARKFPSLYIHPHFYEHYCLPLFPSITQEEIRAVADEVKAAISQLSLQPAERR